MPTINDLRQQAATIKNATQVGENTATRVGTTFETIADLLEGASVGQGVPSVDLSQLNALRTPTDQTTANPTIYNVTTLHNLSSTTIKVGTLFIFSDGGRAVVTQILLSNYQVDGGGNISNPNTSQITMYYRMFNIVQETWSAWTLYAGGGGGGTIDPYPVSGSDNAVASNGVFEGLQKAAPEVDINDIDDLDDYVNMQTGEASTYTIKAYHNLSSTWLRVGVLMVFANQAQNTLTQICISNCMVDGGGNLIPNYTTNVMNVFYRFKQFSGNPPEGVTIGVWTTWAKFGDSGYQPDNEDIDLNANDQLQFASKSYDASAFSGLGRVYLRKNIVTSGGVEKNVLTQAMVNTANTIYHIQYDYVITSDISIPQNCVLLFDGGSIDGLDSDARSIDLNNAELQGNPLIKNAKVSNIKNNTIHLSWLGIDNVNANYNTKTLNWLGAVECKWIIDTDILINDVIIITTRTSMEGLRSSNFAGMFTLTAQNSGAIKYHINYLHGIEIRGFKVKSYGHCFDFASYIYDSFVENMWLCSYNGDCLYFHDEGTRDESGYMQYNFHNEARNIWLFAANGYGITGLKSSLIDNVQSGYCLSTFRRCSCLFMNCNTCYANKYNADGTEENICAKHFLYWDGSETFNRMTVTFIKCNAESYTEEPILDEPANGAVHVFQFNFIQTTIHLYANTTTGKHEYPAIKVYRILEIFADATFISHTGGEVFEDGIAQIVTTYSFHERYNPVLQVGSNYNVVCNGVMKGNTSIYLHKGASTYIPAIPSEGFMYYNTQKHRLTTYNGTRWIGGDGYPAERKYGTTLQRPSEFGVNDLGFPYWDDTLKMMIFWSGNNAFGDNGWVDARFNTPTKRVGKTSERPTNLRNSTSFSDIGFEYFDTDMLKNIYAIIGKEQVLQFDIPRNGGSSSEPGTAVESNTLEQGKMYYATYSQDHTWGGKVVFRKVNSTASDEDGDIVIFSRFHNATMETIIESAPDPNEYPYIVGINNYAALETITIMEQVFVWEEEDGASAGVLRHGTTADRPASTDIYAGFEYFDETLGKPIYWNGTAWVDATGTAV